MRSPLMLHSVSYAGLWGQASLALDQFVPHAAALGFQGVMLMAKRPHLSLVDYGPKERAALRTLLEKHKLPSPVIAGYVNLTADLDHGEMPHREINVHYLVALAQLTADLGGTILRVFTGYEHPAAGYGPQWNLIVATLKEAAQRARAMRVTIGVQNHHDMAVGWQAFDDLLHQVDEPNCRALFDAWAPALHGADLRQAARSLAPRAVHTTVADYQLRPRYQYQPALVNYEPRTPTTIAVPMGEGFIDYAAFFSGLKDGGFTGSVAYEMCSPLRDGPELATLDRYAARFLEYMAAIE